MLKKTVSRKFPSISTRLPSVWSFTVCPVLHSKERIGGAMQRKFFRLLVAAGLLLLTAHIMMGPESALAESHLQQRSDNATEAKIAAQPARQKTGAPYTDFINIPILLRQKTDTHQKIFEFVSADPECKNFNFNIGTNGKGPSGRDNKIFSWGYNQNVFGALEMTKEPSLAYYLETFYEEPDGDMWMETYVQYCSVTDNKTINVIRPFMTAINLSTHQTNSKLTADYLAIDRHDGTQLLYIDPNGVFLSSRESALYKKDNNQTLLYQKMADGVNYAGLLKLDNQNRIYFDLPLYLAALPAQSIPVSTSFAAPGIGPAVQLGHFDDNLSGASISWRNTSTEVARIEEQIKEGASSLAFYTSASKGSMTKKMTLSGWGALGVGTEEPASTLHVNGNEQHLVTTVTGSTTLDNHHTVMCNHATVPFQITLPPVHAWMAGRQYTIKNIGAAAVTVSGAGGTERIDGAAKTVLAQWAAITVQCGTTDGTAYQWFITSRY